MRDSSSPSPEVSHHSPLWRGRAWRKWKWRTSLTSTAAPDVAPMSRERQTRLESRCPGVALAISYGYSAYISTPSATSSERQPCHGDAASLLHDITVPASV